MPGCKGLSRRMPDAATTRRRLLCPAWCCAPTPQGPRRAFTQQGASWQNGPAGLAGLGAGRFGQGCLAVAAQHAHENGHPSSANCRCSRSHSEVRLAEGAEASGPERLSARAVVSFSDAMLAARSADRRSSTFAPCRLFRAVSLAVRRACVRTGERSQTVFHPWLRQNGRFCQCDCAGARMFRLDAARRRWFNPAMHAPENRP